MSIPEYRLEQYMADYEVLCEWISEHRKQLREQQARIAFLERQVQDILLRMSSSGEPVVGEAAHVIQ